MTLALLQLLLSKASSEEGPEEFEVIVEETFERFVPQTEARVGLGLLLCQ